MSIKITDTLRDELAQKLINRFSFNSDIAYYIVDESIRYIDLLNYDNNSVSFQDILDINDEIDYGDWQLDPNQNACQWLIPNTKIVVQLRNLKPDIRLIMDLIILFASHTNRSEKAVILAIKQLIKAFSKLEDEEYCVYFHAQEKDMGVGQIDIIKRGQYYNPKDYLPKCLGNECDNISDIWKCPYQICGRCTTDLNKVKEICEELAAKNILTESFNKTYKFNRW